MQPAPQRQKPAARRRAAALALFLGVAVLALFWRVQDFPFIDFDDPDYVVDNTHLRQELVPEGISWAFTTFRGGNWHPLAWLSHMLDFKLFGLDAGAHHLENVLLHLVNSLLLLRVLFALTGSLWRSALVAALFALHPLHVEPVAWISERKLLLCTFFLLLALEAYRRQLRRRSPARYLLVVLAAALALLSQATAVTLPLLLLLLDFWPLGRLRRGPGGETVPALVGEKAPLFALAGAKALLTMYAPMTLQAVAPLNLVTPLERVGNALISYAQYLKMTVWPAGLAVLYPYPERLEAGQAVLALAALALLSVLAARCAGSKPAVTMGWLWYLLALFPMIGIVQVGAQVRADRYTYLAHLGVFIAAAWAVPRPSGDRALRSALTTLAIPAALCALFLVSWQQVGFWRSNRSLFQRTVEVTRDNYYAQLFLARTYVDEKRYEEALARLQRARELSPAFPLAHIDLGITLGRMGRWPEALAHFREAVRLDPRSAQARRGLADALARLGQVDEASAGFQEAMRLDPQQDAAVVEFAEAIEAGKGAAAAREFFRRVLDANPDNGEAHFGLGLSLAKSGRLDEATTHLSRAVELLPGSAAAQYNLAGALELAGQPERAREHYRRAIAIGPEIPEAHNNLGTLLAESGEIDEAIGHFRQALRLDPRSVEAHYNLVVALRRRNDPAGAAASFRAVLALRPDHLPAREQLRELGDAGGR